MAVPLTLSSVPAQTPYVQYVSGANQTVFPYPFEITQDADLVCLINGVAQPTDGGYTLTGQGATGGGNLTFTAGQTAGTIITLYRNITIARVTQLSQNGTFFSSNFNDEFNRLYLIAQQQQVATSFCLQVPNTNVPSGAGNTLTPAAYAGKGLSFDTNGNPQPFALVSSALTQATFDSFLPNMTFSGSQNSTPGALISKTSNYSGGTAGFVVPAFMAYTQVVQGSANYEWTGLFKLDNYALTATGAQNVALYGQANKYSTGATWAGVFEAIEQNAVNNPVAGTIGVEIDIRANGTDSAEGNRVGCDLVITKFAAGAACQANWGFRIQNSGDGVSNVGYGFSFAPGMIANVGFDTSHGTMSTAAYQMAQGQTIIFDGPTTQANQLGYDGAGLFYSSSGTKGLRLAPTALQINNGSILVQVVGPQQTTGVAAATFVQVDTTTAVSTDSTFDGYTLKQVVKALRIHGLLA